MACELLNATTFMALSVVNDLDYAPFSAVDGKKVTGKKVTEIKSQKKSHRKKSHRKKSHKNKGLNEMHIICT